MLAPHLKVSGGLRLKSDRVRVRAKGVSVVLERSLTPWWLGSAVKVGPRDFLRAERNFQVKISDDWAQ